MFSPVAGCVDVTVTTTADSEAEIGQLQLELAMNEGIYQLLLDETQEGMRTFRSGLLLTSKGT